jgi:hypothetical protein
MIPLLFTDGKNLTSVSFNVNILMERYTSVETIDTRFQGKGEGWERNVDFFRVSQI